MNILWKDNVIYYDGQSCVWCPKHHYEFFNNYVHGTKDVLVLCNSEQIQPSEQTPKHTFSPAHPGGSGYFIAVESQNILSWKEIIIQLVLVQIPFFFLLFLNRQLRARMTT